MGEVDEREGNWWNSRSPGSVQKAHDSGIQRQISEWFELLYLLCQNSVKRAYDKLCHEVLFCLSNHRDTTVSSPKMGEEEMFTGERTWYMRNYF